jgi:hypothetical protein
LRCGEAQPAVGAGEFLHTLEIPKFHNEPAFVRVEKLFKERALRNLQRKARELGFDVTPLASTALVS